MQIRKDFDYYHNLHDTVTHALLHLLFHIKSTSRFVPIDKRNQILVKFLKPKLNDKSLANIKKDIKLMINTARTKGANLERKLYELNEKGNKTKVAGAEKLYSLLNYLYDKEKIDSKLFIEGSQPEPGVLYMLEDHIVHGFDSSGRQGAPLSMLIQLERAPYLVDVINHHGWFRAEMKEWNASTHQAHILIHPA